MGRRKSWKRGDFLLYLNNLNRKKLINIPQILTWFYIFSLNLIMIIGIRLKLVINLLDPY
jgi:hypothetical protein